MIHTTLDTPGKRYIEKASNKVEPQNRQEGKKAG